MLLLLRFDNPFLSCVRLLCSSVLALLKVDSAAAAGITTMTHCHFVQTVTAEDEFALSSSTAQFVIIPAAANLVPLFYVSLAAQNLNSFVT